MEEKTGKDIPEPSVEGKTSANILQIAQIHRLQRVIPLYLQPALDFLQLAEGQVLQSIIVLHRHAAVDGLQLREVNTGQVPGVGDGQVAGDFLDRGEV